MGIEAPHDTFFRSIFQHAERAASWLAAILPAAAVGALDLGSLRPATESVLGVRLRRHQADAVFTANLRSNRAPVLLLVEHKAHPDPQLRSQLLRYTVHLRRAARQGRHGPEPLVLAVVLHHGATRLPAPPSHPHLEGLSPGEVAAFVSMQPRLQFVVDDLSLGDERTLLLPNVAASVQLARLCLRCFWSYSGDDVLAALPRWADLLRTADREHGADVLDAVCWYALAVTEVPPEALIDVVSRILQRPEDTIMSTLERTYQKGRAEGKAEGKAEGRIETLLRQLGRRFGELPADVAARLHHGSSADLDRWTDRVLEANSLAELFAD